MEDGWRVLFDGSGAKAIDDPVGATYTFCRIRNGKIVERCEPRSGYTYFQDAKKKLATRLRAQLEALEKPLIREETTTELVEGA